ncbi:uncharacterized protein si:dkey-283b1.6 [Xyrichtys novacula]|uniref:Uncharacterized protein si:dkey-283b1.6 n=1 Tax=Xyrichtys novacula TaxID=13765 RepID=A0AAV1G6R9_XYRNO|nr:uncharacterized protein si:dkey-283b1.6 [Xyrichtys novacula]
MAFESLPILQIFMGIMGFGLIIIFCTTFCRVCSRIRDEQIEIAAQRNAAQNPHPHSVYFIPFPRNLSQDDEDLPRVPRYSQAVQMPPQYGTSPYSGPPPAYSELGLKPDDMPPAYTENSTPHIVSVQPQSQ